MAKMMSRSVERGPSGPIIYPDRGPSGPIIYP